METIGIQGLLTMEDLAITAWIILVTLPLTLLPLPRMAIVSHGIIGTSLVTTMTIIHLFVYVTKFKVKYLE